MMDNTMTIEQKLNWLDNELGVGFLGEDNYDAINFYYCAMHDYDMGVCDADDWAWLNTLFGYNIGATRSLFITTWYYENLDATVNECVGSQDKETLRSICKWELGLHLDFSNWADDEPKCYDIKEDKLIAITMYADQTGQYTEDEIARCNCTEVRIPESIIREFYEEMGCVIDFSGDYADIEPSFENWIHCVYDNDSTEGLYDFAVQRGFTPICGKKCNDWIWFE